MNRPAKQFARVRANDPQLCVPADGPALRAVPPLNTGVGLHKMTTQPGVMPTWALPALSWLVSFYFLFGFCLNVGFPPDRELLSGDALYVFLWLFFLFLPFFSKVKIGSFLELERELQRTQSELRDFKNEIRNTVSVLSTNVNTIGSMTNQVNINIPGLAELQNARDSVSAKASPNVKAEAKELEQEILASEEDTVLALARTRIEMERLLRLIVGKSTGVNALNDPKYMTLGRLFELFLRDRDNYSYLKQPFQYVSQICNAAIHAQVVSPGHAKEALALGAQIIAVLKDVAVQVAQ